MPALALEAGAAGRKLRHDYWLTVGELVSENFFGQIQTWCQQHNIPSGGHLLLEESIAGHTALYGDFFRCIRKLDAPSIDCLSSLPPDIPWYSARLLASAGELEGRSLVMCETSDHEQRYRPAGDKRPKRTVTEAEIRGTCNKLIVSGVNNITSYYSFADLSDEQLRRLNEWIGRCCAMLRGGRQVADVAVVYPSESLWPGYVPSRHWSRECASAARIESLYRGASDSLFGAQRDFTYVDSRALLDAKVEGGTLVHGQVAVARGGAARSGYAAAGGVGKAGAVRAQGRGGGRAREFSGQQRNGVSIEQGARAGERTVRGGRQGTADEGRTRREARECSCRVVRKGCCRWC